MKSTSSHQGNNSQNCQSCILIDEFKSFGKDDDHLRCSKSIIVHYNLYWDWMISTKQLLHFCLLWLQICEYVVCWFISLGLHWFKQSVSVAWVLLGTALNPRLDQWNYMVTNTQWFTQNLNLNMPLMLMCALQACLTIHFENIKPLCENRTSWSQFKQS